MRSWRRLLRRLLGCRTPTRDAIKNFARSLVGYLHRSCWRLKTPHWLTASLRTYPGSQKRFLKAGTTALALRSLRLTSAAGSVCILAPERLMRTPKTGASQEERAAERKKRQDKLDAELASF